MEMELELKIISASDLTKTSPFTKNKPYVVVSISDNSQKTPVDTESGRNPNWNHLLTFSFPKDAADLTVNFRIRSGCSLAGEVCVPLRDLLNSSPVSKAPAAAKFVSYQVKKPSGRAKGVLTFSYRFVDKLSGAMAAGEQVHFPVNPQARSPLYPPLEALYPPLPNPSPAVTGYPSLDGYKYDVYPPPPAVNYRYPVHGGNGYGYPVQPVNGYPHTSYRLLIGHCSASTYQ